MKQTMMRSKLVPNMVGTFVREVNSEYFILLCKGKEILCHYDYWTIERY